MLPELPEKFFLYTGALESRYGIDVLVDWFKDDNFLPGWSLVLCGTGGLDAVISKLAKSKPKRVVFLGQVKRNIALELQKHADILVNPRSPIDAYTAYSFPSKTLEYMASGTPIVMHKLDGIPSEYFDYMYLPKSVTHAALKETLLEVASLSNQSRFDFGQKAKNFILFNKSPESQGKRLLNFLISISKG
nr:glycosyltransferase [Pseudoalteromonas sp. WY3]